MLRRLLTVAIVSTLLAGCTLMQVAGEDYIVDAGSSEAFFQKLGLDDKTFYRYPGLYHEIYNERPDLRNPVLADLEAWLDKMVS